jgi:hypothetical protein
VTTIWRTDPLAQDEPTLGHAMVELTVDERVQELVHELMRARLTELFGPGGSFRIALGRGTAEDALFVATVADTIAWDVAAALEGHDRATPRRLADQLPSDEHEAIWKHVEDELLRRRKAA